MKRFIIAMVALAATCGAFAQTKTAYIDLYQRGNGTKLTTSVLFDKKAAEMGKTNLGNALNVLAKYGWTVDQTMVIGGKILVFNRHKFHVILKKEYQEGEYPFEGLATKPLKQEVKAKPNVKNPDLFFNNKKEAKLKEKAAKAQAKAAKSAKKKK